MNQSVDRNFDYLAERFSSRVYENFHLLASTRPYMTDKRSLKASNPSSLKSVRQWLLGSEYQKGTRQESKSSVTA